MPAAHSTRAWSVIALLAVTLAGAALRLADLGKDSFVPNEVGEINTAAALRFPGDQVWRPVASLSTWVTAATLGLGYEEATLRLPSALAGTLTIPAVWGLGVLAFGAETGVYAAAALAMAPLHVALSRSVGADTWLTFLVTLTVLTFTWAVQRPQDWQRQITCAGAALLACACGYRALLVLAATAIAAVVMAAGQPVLRRLARRWCLFTLLVAAAAVALAIYFPPQSKGSFLRPDFSWRSQLQLLSQLATGQPQRWWVGVAGLASVATGFVTTAGSQATILSATWLLVGVAGLLITEWSRRLAFQPADVAFVLPAYLLLGAAGLTWLRRTIFADTVRPLGRIGQMAALVLLLAVELPGLREQATQYHPAWRAAARVVAANVRPGDTLVVLGEQPSFAFYAPDLEERMEPDVRPARAATYFVHPKRGWLVAPASLQQLGGWKRMQDWLARFPPVDLSPDAATVVLYMGREGHEPLVFETAYFTLPTATLVRGTLLFDWLQKLGPVPAVLWKVDQIVLSREPLDFHNPSLLHAVYYLAQHDHGDRAASLAYRLATAEPQWEDAQQALAAFRPGS